MNERELADYLDARRGDVSTWSTRPVGANVRKGRQVVFSLRLPAQELEDLRLQAEQDGVTVSDLIRWALLTRTGYSPNAVTYSLFVPCEGTANRGIIAIDARQPANTRGARTFDWLMGPLQRYTCQSNPRPAAAQASAGTATRASSAPGRII